MEQTAMPQVTMSAFRGGNRDIGGGGGGGGGGGSKGNNGFILALTIEYNIQFVALG